MRRCCPPRLARRASGRRRWHCKTLDVRSKVAEERGGRRRPVCERRGREGGTPIKGRTQEEEREEEESGGQREV